ncbi:hypothetical protein [Micromonospora zamorensis]|uniref:hypothetical protein n=1 Tax=Micromonospora zamorensis TaxID=709883 RepID=UPI0033B25802
MRDLERRYRQLLRAYPAGYRQARGGEIVGTYLDLADPDRHWPSMFDVTDVLAGGVRERLRAAGAADLIPGIRLAAVLSLITATALAGFWGAAEVVTTSASWGAPAFGPFATTGVVLWGCWLLAAVVHVIAPARWARVAIGLALFLTAAVVPVQPYSSWAQPPWLPRSQSVRDPARRPTLWRYACMSGARTAANSGLRIMTRVARKCT